MGDERRWAARYQFLEQVWRGQDRIVCDRELEAALHAGPEGAVGELLGGLLPAEGGDARAWVALYNDRRAVSFARARSGTVFASLDDGPELAADEPWKVALVDLGESVELDGLETFVEILAERAEDDPSRTIVLSVRCGTGEDDEDETYEALADLVAEQFGDGRIYGLTRPKVAAFFDFGPVLEDEGGDDEGGGAEGGVEFDNSLGSEEPRFELFVAVIGEARPSEGALYVELPGAERSASAPPPTALARAESEELAALRVQLSEAQRRGDLQAIERQELLEELERSQDRVANLEEELDAQGSSIAAQASQRLDTVLASEQSLRWQLDQARSELEASRARPVDELEAELATLQAKLERAEQLRAFEITRREALERTLTEQTVEEGAASGAEGDDDDPSPSQARAWLGARGRLESLLRKLERGSRVSALELHRELQALKKLL